MSGESYGVGLRLTIWIVNINQVHFQGRYLPLFASAVYDQNTQLIASGLTPVNLQSVMIGSHPAYFPHDYYSNR